MSARWRGVVNIDIAADHVLPPPASACTPCRQTKRKCDGGQPCSSCQRRKFPRGGPCEYVAPHARNTKSSSNGSGKSGKSCRRAARQPLMLTTLPSRPKLCSKSSKTQNADLSESCRPSQPARSLQINRKKRSLARAGAPRCAVAIFGVVVLVVVVDTGAPHDCQSWRSRFDASQQLQHRVCVVNDDKDTYKVSLHEYDSAYKVDVKGTIACRRRCHCESGMNRREEKRAVVCTFTISHPQVSFPCFISF